MNILLLGSGGREHAIAWKLTQSGRCTSLFIAPGNAGTAMLGTNCDFKAADFEASKKLCIKEDIRMVIVGPEDPLVLGIWNFFKNDPELSHIMVIGPSKEAAQLEGSKAFAKAFMQKNNIPTAKYKEFTSETYDDGVKYIREHDLPVVLKADGLASGKGVLICNSHLEALAEFDLIVMQSKFGDAGSTVVIEEFLTGIEMSFFILTDGNDFVVLPEAKDYKRIGEGDRGLNTGGMGAVSPLPFFDKNLHDRIIETIVKPTISGLQEAELEYIGFIFFGLMINEDNMPYVIEYNCRLGDPETEVVIPRLKNDLVDLFEAAATKGLSDIKIDVDERAAATIMAVSGGYPGQIETGYPISGTDFDGESILFHAATKKTDEGIVTSGGRVIAVTSFGEDISDAISACVRTLGEIDFEDIYYRRDIGYEFMRSSKN